MSLEVYTGLIKDLVITNPTPTDPKSQGDDHLRGIKKTMVEDCVRVSTAGFCKNKLFNGEVTRINQRGFDGNWATKNIWAGGNTIAQQELCYGYDMWAKQDGANMLQVIEAGNFRPSTVHTISGIGVTTRQETSPASGNWVIGNIPYNARNVQVEEGSVATPFEIRPYGFELAQCQRYLFGVSYSTNQAVISSGFVVNDVQFRLYFAPPETLRESPFIQALGVEAYDGVITLGGIALTGFEYCGAMMQLIFSTTGGNPQKPCVGYFIAGGYIKVSAVI